MPTIICEAVASSSGEKNEPPKLIRNIFGGAVGGPIIKNRLFFFANYKGARQREENSVLRVVPSDALRDGVMTYQCAVASQCPGMTVAGLTGSHTIDAGFYGLSPTDLTNMDPVTAVAPGTNRYFILPTSSRSRMRMTSISVTE